MAIFSWLEREQELSPAALTLRAQTIPPNDTGELRWDLFFPRNDVDSVKIREVYDLDLRRTSDRREWNARGRKFDFGVPERVDWEMVPIEGYFDIGEREMQALTEQALGNQALIRELIMADVPSRVDEVARGNLRRIEFDAFEAWALGQITAMNPATGATTTLSLGFDAARYQTAGTAWSDGAVNAYDELLSFLEDALEEIGSLSGTMLRLATLRTIQEDASGSLDTTASRVSRAAVEDAISDEFGTPFTFFVNEDSHDVYDDAGVAVTRTKVWPSDVVAAVPAGGVVGGTHFAPVARGWEISQAEPEAEIDVRGQTAWLETSNGGRHLTGEVQVNALPLPNEQRVFVIDTTP